MYGVECRVKMDDDGEKEKKEDTGGDAQDPFKLHDSLPSRIGSLEC